MADIVNVHQAKTHLSRLLERVRRGATITIAKAGDPVAHLVPAGRSPPGRRVREPTAVPARDTDRRQRLHRFLEQEVWPAVPPGLHGRPLTREEEDQILGYGPQGA